MTDFQMIIIWKLICSLQFKFDGSWTHNKLKKKAEYWKIIKDVSEKKVKSQHEFPEGVEHFAIRLNKTLTIQLTPRFQQGHHAHFIRPRTIQTLLLWVDRQWQGQTNGLWHYLSPSICKAERRALHSNCSLRRHFLRSKAAFTTVS